MYSLINTHAHLVVGTIGNQDVQTYLQLCARLRQPEDISHDVHFQNLYRKFWRMNRAGLNEQHYAVYFHLLEQARNGEPIALQHICQQLYEIPIGEQHRIQFSFATKLKHMVDPNVPIYDSMVRAFYFLPELKSDKNYEARLQCLLASYNFLGHEYQRIKEVGLLEPAIDTFRGRFGLVVSPVKEIDWLIWRFVSQAQEGAFRERTFSHI